jgi:hypothetical protein
MSTQPQDARVLDRLSRIDTTSLVDAGRGSLRVLPPALRPIRPGAFERPASRDCCGSASTFRPTPTPAKKSSHEHHERRRPARRQRVQQVQVEVPDPLGRPPARCRGADGRSHGYRCRRSRTLHLQLARTRGDRQIRTLRTGRRRRGSCKRLKPGDRVVVYHFAGCGGALA